MKFTTRILNITLIVLFVSLAVVGTAHAQDTGGSELLSPFAPILAAAASIERLLQFIRNIISPDPKKGPLARGTAALLYDDRRGCAGPDHCLHQRFPRAGIGRYRDAAGARYDPHRCGRWPGHRVRA
jgi:hypothetical protein